MANDLEQLAAREAATVLTPHAGELGRLLEIGSSAVDARRLASAREAAARAGAVVVLKGDDTIAVDPDGRPRVNGVSQPGAGDRRHRRRAHRDRRRFARPRARAA